MYATLALDDKQFNSGINAAKTGATGFGNVAKVAFAAVAAAAAATAVAVIKVGSDFEAQMSVVKSISGATANEMVSLADKAKYMGATTQFTATEAGQAFEYMAMAGWKTNDMLAGLEGIMYAAGASGENLGMVADIVTDGLTAFGESADQSGRFADVLAAASANANTNIGMLGESFKYVAPVAGALGYSIEDTSLALGLMANAGIKSSTAGTALRSTLSSMAAPTDKQAAAMEELGLSLTDSEGRTKSLREVLGDFRDSMADLDATQQAYYATSIGGDRAMAGLLAIINTSEEEFNKLAVSIDNSAGAAQRMNEVRLDNLKGDVVILGSAVEGLGIQIYGSFQNPLREAVQAGISGVNNLASELAKPKMKNAIDDIGDSFSSLVKTVSNITTAIIPPFVSGLGAIIKNLDVLIPIVGGLFVAFKAYSIIQNVTLAMQNSQRVFAALNTLLTTSTSINGLFTASLASQATAEAVRTAAKVAGMSVDAAGNLITAQGTAATVAETAAILANSGVLSAKTLIVGLLTKQIDGAAARQWLWNAAMTANPIGLVVAGIAVLVGAIAGLTAIIRKNDKELQANREATKKIIEEQEALANSVEQSAAAYADKTKTIKIDTTASKDLLGTIDKLIAKEKQAAAQGLDTAATRHEIAKYIDLFNESMGESILSYDKETGEINKSIQAIEQLIETRIKEAESAASIERIVEIRRELTALEEANQKLEEEGFQKREKGWKDYAILLAGPVGTSVESVLAIMDYVDETKFNESLKSGTEDADGLRIELENLEQELVAYENTAAEAAEGTAEAIAATAEQWIAANGQVMASQDELEERNKQIQDSIQSYVDSVTSMYDAINEKSDQSREEQLRILEKNQQANENFVANMKILMEKGLDKAIAQQWLEAGEKGIQQAALWKDGTVDEIKQLNEQMATNTISGTDNIIGLWEGSDIPETMTGVFGTALAESQGKIAEFMAFGSGLMESVGNGIEAGADDTSKKMTTAAGDIEDAWRTKMDQHSPSTVFVKLAAGLMESIAKGIDDNKGKVTTSIKNFATDTIKQMTIVGEDMAKGFIAGMTSKLPDVQAAAKNLATTAIVTAQTTLEVHSPSRVFFDIGENTGIGYINGTNSTIPAIISATTNMAGAVVDKTKDLLGVTETTKSTTFSQFGVNTVEGFVEGLNSMADAVQEVLGDTFDISEVMSTIESRLESYTDIATDMFNRISTESEVSVEEMISNLKHNQKALADWADNIAKLADRGINEGLLETLRAAGPQSAGTVAELVSATDEQLEELSNTYGKGGESSTQALLTSLGLGVPLMSEPGTAMIDVVAQAMSGNMSMNDAMATLVNGARSIGLENVAGMADIGGEAVSKVASGISSNSGAATNAAADVASGVKTALSDVAPESNNLDKWISGLESTANSGIPKVIDGIVKLFNELPAKTYTAILPTKDKITEWGTLIISVGTDKTKQFVEAIITNINPLPAKFYDTIKPTIDKVAQWGVLLIAAGQKSTKDFVEGVVNNVKDLPIKFYDAIFPAVAKVQEWADDLTSKAKTEMPKFVQAILELIKVLPDEFKTIGVNMIQGMIDGLESKESDLYDAITKIAKEAARAAKKELDIESPSKVFAEIGAFTAEGFIVGLQSMASAVESAVGNVFSMDDVYMPSFTAGSVGGGQLAYATTGGTSTGMGGATIIQNIQSVPQTQSQFEAATLAAFQRARWQLT